LACGRQLADYDVTVKVPYRSHVLGLSRDERKSLCVLSYFKTTLIPERAGSKWFIKYNNVT